MSWLLWIMLHWTWECRSSRSGFHFLKIYTQKSWIAGLQSKKNLFSFVFLRKLHTIFHNGCTNLHFHQRRTRIPFSAHPHQHFPLVFLRSAVPCATWSLRAGFICISFPWSLVMRSTFPVPVGHLYVFFRKMSFPFLCPFLYWTACWVVYFFSLLSGNQLPEYITLKQTNKKKKHLFVLLTFASIWIVSSLGLLWIELWRVLVWMSLCSTFFFLISLA